MRQLIWAFAIASLVGLGCRRDTPPSTNRLPNSNPPAKATGNVAAESVPAEQVVPVAPNLASPIQPKRKLEFSSNDMVQPIREFQDYPIGDYRKLPNCLDVFQACVAVPFESRTEAQYKSAVCKIARQPCRVVLEVVDISADYDFGAFKLLHDDDSLGSAALRHAGDLGGYAVQDVFAINGVKSKGLDPLRTSRGDRVVLVGIGDVVPASPWGAGRYSTKGSPTGDERYVMLRAFGMPNKFRVQDYEFAVMVRNWYIASQ